MAITLVANGLIPGAVSGATSSAINTTGASLLVVSVSWYQNVPRPALTDSKGNTWVALTEIKFSVTGNVLYYCKNPTVGSGHTFTLAQSGSYCSGQILAFSGTDTTAPFDVENGASVTRFSVPPRPGSITPSVDGCVLVVGMSSGDGTSGFSIDGGFTLTDQVPQTSSVCQGAAAAYLVQTSAAAANPTWYASVPTAGAPGICTAIAAFKPAAGGGGAGIDATITGATLRTAARLTPGAVTAAPVVSISGASLRIAARLNAGSMSANTSVTVPGASLRTAARLTAGAVTAAPALSIGGASLRTAARLTPGAMSASTGATISGASLRTAARLTAGGFSASPIVSGASLRTAARLYPGAMFVPGASSGTPGTRLRIGLGLGL